MVGLLLKVALLLVAVILFGQWLRMVFKFHRPVSVFELRIDSASGHNMVLGDIGGVILSASVMLLLFVFHSELWMYPLMLISVLVMLGRTISFIQQGFSHIGSLSMAIEALVLIILGLFALGWVGYTPIYTFRIGGDLVG